MRLLALLIGLLPMLAFLLALILLDSYKLVRLPAVLKLLAAGALAAAAALALHLWLREALALPARDVRSISPLSEELLKGSIVAYLVIRHRVGFLVDAAVCGFAIGAGFAALENIYYSMALESVSLSTWLVRGFGTAILHGGVTASMAVWSRSLADRRGSTGPGTFLPGLLLAVAIHSAFNRVLVSPNLATLLVIATLCFAFMAIFEVSERGTRAWLGTGFDTDAELLALMRAGEVSRGRIGHYLGSLKQRFEPATVADMLCLLRLRLELSIRAKGILILRKAGATPKPDPEVREKFAELRFLERAIGPTGLRALAPILNFSDQDLWQFHMLDRQG